MISNLVLALFGLLTVANAKNFKDKYTSINPKDVYRNQEIAMTSSPTSNIKGKAFDRFVVIFGENTDYELASADPNLSWLAKKGITLTQKYAVTHPSEPNYVASHCGDTFGMDNDDFNQFPGNVSTIIDLLEEKGISWSEYQEDMPFSGFEGYDWLNQATGANDYVRKHNPAVIFNSAARSEQRLSQMKNMTMFYEDLDNDKLPQWMFITPNMTSDGHDTSVTVFGLWTRNLLEPLLKNKNFMKNTLVLVTFDENETYVRQNRIFSFLIGDAIPKDLVGTKDDTFYDHYSQLSTVEANWDLYTLGRWDVGANVYKMVADVTGDKLRKWKSPPFSEMFFNESYPGPFSDQTKAPLPVPDTNANYAGRTVAPSIQKKWGAYVKDTYYTTQVEIPDGQHPPQEM